VSSIGEGERLALWMALFGAGGAAGGVARRVLAVDGFEARPAAFSWEAALREAQPGSFARKEMTLARHATGRLSAREEAIVAATRHEAAASDLYWAFALCPAGAISEAQGAQRAMAMDAMCRDSSPGRRAPSPELAAALLKSGAVWAAPAQASRERLGRFWRRLRAWSGELVERAAEGGDPSAQARALTAWAQGLSDAARLVAWQNWPCSSNAGIEALGSLVADCRERALPVFESLGAPLDAAAAASDPPAEAAAQRLAFIGALAPAAFRFAAARFLFERNGAAVSHWAALDGAEITQKIHGQWVGSAEAIATLNVWAREAQDALWSRQAFSYGANLPPCARDLARRWAQGAAARGQKQEAEAWDAMLSAVAGGFFDGNKNTTGKARWAARLAQEGALAGIPAPKFRRRIQSIWLPAATKRDEEDVVKAAGPLLAALESAELGSLAAGARATTPASPGKRL
jgi:hypothetical protein